MNTNNGPFLAAAATLLALASLSSANAATCPVPAADYPTIQAALNDAACDTVRVAPGRYFENLRINRRVVLTGEDRDAVVIDGGRVAQGILVRPRVFAVIANLTVTNGFNRLDGAGVAGENDSIVVLNGVRLTGNAARSGAGGYAGASSLFVLNSLIDNNIGGGLSAPPGSGPGRLVVLNTTLEGNVLSSPAVVYANELTMRDSVVRGNRGDDGVWFFEGSMQTTLVADNLIDTGACAVRVSERGTVQTSTITGNVSQIAGGVCNSAGQLTISNSTITNNVGLSDAGGVSQTFPANNVATTVQYSTIVDNVGPVGDSIGVAFGAVFVRASIIASETSGEGCRGVANGQVVSLGSNVATDDSCSLTRDSDQPNVADVGLAALADNGGPTPTHALLPGSPAIDSVGGSD
ncbi:MAG: choice-of-anchor Q domain-containing protein, partial [Pseudomonadota bacterium]